MTEAVRAVIAGTGSYLPEKILSNQDFEKMVDTSDEWIITRTGIKTRHIAGEGETCSDMGAEAGRRALLSAGVKPEELDLVIVATFTGDRVLPATACLVQAKLGAVNAGAFDVAAACSGFVYSLSCAWGLIRGGVYKKILVVGAEVLSAFTDYQDRGSCILFGDGAGAVVLVADEGNESKRGIMTCRLGADGSQADMMTIPAGGSEKPISAETLEKREQYMRIRGREVFKFAASKMQELIQSDLERCGLTYRDVSMVVPHQVNTRILDFAAEKCNLPAEKMFVNIDRVGNTSAASVPIALDEANRKGLLKPEDGVGLIAFGGGLSWASIVLRW